MLAAAILALTTPAAPAPRHRPAPAVSVVGAWRMSYGGRACGVRFSPDGSYASEYGGEGEPQVGTWLLDGHILTVEEWAVDRGDCVNVWKATLVPGKTSGTRDRIPFALTKP